MSRASLLTLLISCVAFGLGSYFAGRAGAHESPVANEGEVGRYVVTFAPGSDRELSCWLLVDSHTGVSYVGHTSGGSLYWIPAKFKSWQKYEANADAMTKRRAAIDKIGNPSGQPPSRSWYQDFVEGDALDESELPPPQLSARVRVPPK